jgi:general secretion pathway protein B
MSYILDALKKAERERGLSEMPTLETVHDFPKSNRFGIWTALGLLVLCMLTALWLFYPSRKKVLHSPASEVVGANQGPVQSSAALPSVAVLSQPVRPIETPVLPLKKMIGKPDSAVSSPSSGDRLNNAKPDVAKQVLSPKQADPASLETLENAAQSKIPSRNMEAPSPAVQTKPLSLRDAVAGMNMSIHLYSENKAERLVFINGKKYFEGDSLEQGIFLESITPEGAVLRSGEERAVLRPGSR